MEKQYIWHVKYAIVTWEKKTSVNLSLSYLNFVSQTQSNVPLTNIEPSS